MLVDAELIDVIPSGSFTLVLGGDFDTLGDFDNVFLSLELNRLFLA